MNQLHQQLKHNDFTLLVSLPANKLEFAQAALNGGAHGLKVHVNVEHFASGTRYGSWSEESEVLAQIVALAQSHNASVGVVPGATGEGVHRFATEEDFAQMAQIGVDYFDAYPADAPAWTLAQKHLDVMMAAYHGGTIEELRVLEHMGMTLCEASIMHHDEYGHPLSARDLVRYHALCDALESPVIIPSQKKLTPRDVPFLKKSGACGVLIGAIVTGREAQSIEDATRAFAQEIVPQKQVFGFSIVD